MPDAFKTISSLEGAILGEVKRLGPCTTYRIRRSFQDSPSAEWSASAGAVYPAIHRLIAGGLLAETEQSGDRRGARLVALTAAGEASLAAWVLDVPTAVGAGYDPFRARIGAWDALATAERVEHLQTLAASLGRRIAELDALIGAAPQDDPQTWRMELERRLQAGRLDWLRERWGRDYSPASSS